ncbi:MAG: hypothetical protein NT169_20825 [Chloroflexi bacterium]|nr:hypothetical protein [Chloroflexota bacterium]
MDTQKLRRVSATPEEVAFITQALRREPSRGVRGFTWCMSDPSFKATRQSDNYQVTVHIWLLEEFVDDKFSYDVRLPAGWSVEDMEPSDDVIPIVRQATYNDKLTVQVYQRLPADHTIRVGPADDSNGRPDDHTTILRPDHHGDTYKLKIPIG